MKTPLLGVLPWLRWKAERQIGATATLEILRCLCYPCDMRYEGKIYRPPSEADAFILQATIGCSWNHCTYCDMYREKRYRQRPFEELVEDIAMARVSYGSQVKKIFVADGDALTIPTDDWLELLDALSGAFPDKKRVSCYATARNLLEKTQAELDKLYAAGLTQLYIGPESGDDTVLKMIAKGGTFADHAEAAQKANAAGMKLSAIFLLGAGGTKHTQAHAERSAELATEMNPRFLSALTLTVVPGTPIARMQEMGNFVLPDVEGLLRELRTLIDLARPDDAIFRTNHASNYLPLGGRLPKDRERLLEVLDSALNGEARLRPEWARGL